MSPHRRGHWSRLSNKLDYKVTFPLSTWLDSVVTPQVKTEDLIDSLEVAELLGLTHRNSVSTYLKRYADMPRPVVERGGGRTRLWLRQEIEAWAEETGRFRHQPTD